MPAKKAPATKATPRKKIATKLPRKDSPGKEVKSQTPSDFDLEVQNQKTVVVNTKGRFVFIDRSMNLTNGDLIVIVTRQSATSIPMPQEDVKVIKGKTTGSPVIKAIGYNVPPDDKTPARVQTNLSIFHDIKRFPEKSKIEFKHTANGLPIFTIGIEG